MAMIVLLALPASAAAWRDTVIEAPSVGSASISVSADANRYPIDDGSGETVAISVTEACQVVCTAANPQQIADFLGTLIHGPEMELLTVQLDTPSQIEFDCGYGAQACYYGSENKIVLSGDDTPAPEGASREFVLAHEYGHHRRPPPRKPGAVSGRDRLGDTALVELRARLPALAGRSALSRQRGPALLSRSG